MKPKKINEALDKTHLRSDFRENIINPYCNFRTWNVIFQKWGDITIAIAAYNKLQLNPCSS